MLYTLMVLPIHTCTILFWSILNQVSLFERKYIQIDCMRIIYSDFDTKNLGVV